MDLNKVYFSQAFARARFPNSPSVLKPGHSPYGNTPQTLDLAAFCQDPNTGAAVPNCDITINWSAVSGSGGHVHHDAKRPPGIFKVKTTGVTGGFTNPDQSRPATVMGNSGNSGFLPIIYTAPEVSGVINGSTVGFGTLNGVPTQFRTTPFTIGVRINDDLQLAGGTGLQVTIESDNHGNNNGNATQPTINALQSLAVLFAAELKRQGVPADKVPPLRATAISLPQGGLFDYKNANWKIPKHTDHRFGNNVDVGMKGVTPLTEMQKQALARALEDTLFETPIRAESPTEPNADHWHLCLPPVGCTTK